MGDREARGRKGTSSGWTEGPEVRRREPVKARKWEQEMKFRLGMGRRGTGSGCKGVPGVFLSQQSQAAAPWPALPVLPW